MILTLKFRVYPTKTQERIMDETLETCRRLYNVLLSDRMENGTRFYEQSKKLVALKRVFVGSSLLLQLSRPANVPKVYLLRHCTEEKYALYVE